MGQVTDEQQRLGHLETPCPLVFEFFLQNLKVPVKFIFPSFKYHGPGGTLFHVYYVMCVYYRNDKITCLTT